MYLITISFAWVLGIFAASIFSIPVPFIFTGFVPVSLMFIFKHHLKLLALTSLFLFTFFGAALYYPIAQSANQDADIISGTGFTEVKGIINSQPEFRDKYTYLKLSVSEVKTESGWQTREGKILILAQRFPEYKYGDILLVSGVLEKPPVFEDFDYQTYLARNDIYFIMYSPHIDLIDRITGFNILSWIYTLRNHLSLSLAAALPEPQAALAQGIVLGIRSSMPDSLKNDFSITGTAHLLAISGVNLSIITGLLITIGVWLFGRRHYLYIWLALFLIWFYFLITGVQAPVFRAAIMASIFLIAELLGRQKNTFAALSLSAAIMVGINPDTLFDVSFQLTYAAMLGLIFIASPLNNFIHQAIFKKLGEEGLKIKTLILVSDSLFVSLGAILAVWPIITFYFGTFSILGPLATLLIAPSLPLIIILGSATALAGLFSPPLAQGIGWITWLPLSYMLGMVNVFANLPFAAIHTGKINSFWIFIYYAILILVFLFKLKIKKTINLIKTIIDKINNVYKTVSNLFIKLPVRLAIIPLLVAAFLTSYTAATMPDEYLHVSILDVGEGDAVLIQNGTQNILIDGGPSPQAVCSGLGAKLRFWDRKIDLIILTHPHLDHLSGLIEVLKRYQVKQVLFLNSVSNSPAYQEWLNLIEAKQISAYPGRSGQKINLNYHSELEILNPPDLSSSESDNDLENKGIVVRLSRDHISFLFTADIAQTAESRMLQEKANLKSTIIKVAHHGSNSSSSAGFMAVSQPQFAVISAGADNQFGHPGEQTMDRLKESLGSENHIYRTDKSGTIEFTTDGEKLWVKTDR
jgi:competence protein ComEC